SAPSTSPCRGPARHSVTGVTQYSYDFSHSMPLSVNGNTCSLGFTWPTITGWAVEGAPACRRSMRKINSEFSRVEGGTGGRSNAIVTPSGISPRFTTCGTGAVSTAGTATRFEGADVRPRLVTDSTW